MTRKKDSRRSSRRRASRPALFGAAAATAFGLGIAISTPGYGAHEGLPFTEPFDDAHLSDPDSTRADWGGTVAGELRLPVSAPLTDAFGPGTVGENVGSGEFTFTTRALAMADMNGDGLLDLVEASAQTNQVYLNDGAGNFPVGTPIAPYSANTRGIGVGDMDGDGDVDVVTGNLGGGAPPRLYLNSGDGVQFVGSDISTGAPRIDAVAVADLNGDGRLDVVAATHQNYLSRIYYNTGDPSALFDEATLGNSPDHSQSVAVGDIDNDGDTDIVLINEAQDNKWYRNDGDGSFTESPIGTEQHNSQGGALADLDGDGFLDLVVGNYIPGQPNQIYFHSGDPAAPFDGVVPVELTAPNQISYVHHVNVGDIDNDGDIDILLSTAGVDAPVEDTTRFTNRLYLNDGSGGFTEVEIGADLDVTNTIAVGDVDNDGDLDLVAGNEGRDEENDAFPLQNRLYRNTGTAEGDSVLQLHGVAASLRVDAETAEIATVSLTAAPETLGPNNRADFWVSSNGGANWLHIVPGGAPVEFDEGIRGADLRWRADLSSLSPAAVSAGALAIDSITLDSDMPRFTSAPVTEAAADEAYTYDVTATDPDEAETLTLAAPTLPAWLTLTDNGDGTGTLSGTPTSADAGANDVVLEVANSAGSSSRQSFTIDVAAPGAPSFTSTPVTAATVGADYAYSITASDPDEGDTLTLTAPTLPAWLTLTDNGDGTGTLAGTPDAANIGEHAVVLQVEDGAGAIAEQRFTVAVADAGSGNSAPAFASEPPASATEGEELSYTATATDDDGDALTLTAPTLPDWLTFTDNGDGTGTLVGTPGADHVGDHEVVIEAADANGGTVQQTFTVTVAAAEEPPVENPPAEEPPPPASSNGGGGGGSTGLGELLGLLLIAVLTGRRSRFAPRSR